MTYANGKALVVLEDASTIVMSANAELEFDDDSHIKQASGEAYYQIVKRPKQKGLHVTTPFSIIGIKGTEFIVNFDHDGQVALNEGIVSISSTDEEAKFELYQQQELSDFEKYKAKQNSGFKAYKKRLEDAIVSYVNSFDLQSHKILTFKKAETCKEACSKQVLEEDFTQEVNAKFKEYQRLMSQWK